MPGKRYGLEYDRKKRQERLETATKSLKTAIVKENMREFRAEQEREQQRRRREYGKVVYEVGPRDRSDQIRRLEHRRAMENMERRRRNSQRIHRFYAAKDEETDSDSDEEEDEVLDFHKQKSEVIFWNDPRIRMTKKDMHLSTLARSFGIMTITVEDTGTAEEERVKEEHHLQLKGDAFSSCGPLDRLRRTGLLGSLVPRSKQRAAGWNMNPEDKNIRECKPVYFLW